jgi:hypothetical protein
MDTNVLYYGDNLEVLHKHIPDESIDLTQSGLRVWGDYQ